MDRSELLRKLTLLRDGLAKDAMVPMWQCFMFDGANVTACNAAIVISTPCDTAGMAFAVEGRTLLAWLSTCGDPKVDIVKGTDQVALKCGKSTFKMPFYEVEEFVLPIAEIETWMYSPKITQDFIKGLEVCLQTSSADLAMPALMGICFNTDTNALYSCDGDAITRFKLQSNIKPNGSCMLGSAFCEAVCKISDETDEYAEIISVNEQWARMEIAGYTIWGQLIVNDNPIDHEQFIQDTVKVTPTYVAVPDDLPTALIRARVIADIDSAATLLTVTGGSLRLTTANARGRVREVMGLPGCPDVVAAVSAEKVQKAITLCPEMAILENCTLYREENNMFRLIGNMDNDDPQDEISEG